mgnify:CR=1 FL=1
METAQFYRRLDEKRILCYLCPRYCKLKPGQIGFCQVRQNIGGELKSLVYGKPYAVNVDPIEKKPLFHFLPGSKILSIGTAGCNMACKYCQNWNLSDTKFEEERSIYLPPERVIQLAVHYKTRSIAYTYNEPTIFAEYVMDTARLSQSMKLKNVMVTNGYITLEAIDQVYQHIDAANVDLKAFSEQFYSKLTLSHLQPVLDCLKRLKQLNKWIEITNLIIPTYNDQEKEVTALCEWILQELGPFVPLHFSAFHPEFKLTHVPPTTPSTLIKFRRLAMKLGIKYVYVGNISDSEGNNTYCHNCSTLLIRRSWYHTECIGLELTKCKKCGAVIPGILN